MRRIAAALIAFGIVPVTAQQPSFKSTVELVTVPLAVTNVTRDKLITGGLTAADFRVFEDGVPQEISLFSQDRRPTSLCIVVDASGSMARANRHDLGVAALRHTVRGLEKGDEVAIVRFAEASRWRSPFLIFWSAIAAAILRYPQASPSLRQAPSPKPQAPSP